MNWIITFSSKKSCKVILDKTSIGMDLSLHTTVRLMSIDLGLLSCDDGLSYRESLHVHVCARPTELIGRYSGEVLVARICQLLLSFMFAARLLNIFCWDWLLMWVQYFYYSLACLLPFTWRVHIFTILSNLIRTAWLVILKHFELQKLRCKNALLVVRLTLTPHPGLTINFVNILGCFYPFYQRKPCDLTIKWERFYTLTVSLTKNKLAKLRRHASRVHFAKILFQ